MKKMVFVPYGILVTTPCDSRTISFANEFSQMAFVGPLTICLYYSDAPVVGSMTTFYWWCPWRFFASIAKCCAIGSTLVPFALVLYRCVARGRSYLFPLYWPRRRCFTSYFNFLVYFLLVASDDGVAWIGLVSFCYLFLDSSSGSTLGGGAVWSSTLGSLVLFSISEL